MTNMQYFLPYHESDTTSDLVSQACFHLLGKRKYTLVPSQKGATNTTYVVILGHFVAYVFS